MYWQVDTYTDSMGYVWKMYNYFHIVSTVNQKPPYFNPRTKAYTFYPTKQVIIRSGLFDSSEAFQVWWEQNKSL